MPTELEAGSDASFMLRNVSNLKSGMYILVVNGKQSKFIKK